MRAIRLFWLATASLLAAIANADVVQSTANITIESGPHAGTYYYASPGPCTMLSSGLLDAPAFNAVFQSEKSVLAVDMPSIDVPTQFQVEVVVADATGAPGHDTASTIYAIDTRPDAVLERYQREERVKLGMTGRGAVKLVRRGSSATVTFAGATAGGINLKGAIECFRVIQERRQ